MKNKSIEKYYFEKRNDILQLIPVEVKTILDVGCGSAITYKGKNFNVTGIEIVPEIAKFAKENISSVIVGNVEKLPLKNCSFDCIIFGDILEHLKDPWSLLIEIKRFLNENGFVIASIPNLQYYKIVRKILKDKFHYEEYGILDIDHLRFFTLSTIKEMFKNAGFKIIKIDRKIKWKIQYKIMNFLFFNRLENFFTYQYYILAQKR